jgi:hypothetical protein
MKRTTAISKLSNSGGQPRPRQTRKVSKSETKAVALTASLMQQWQAAAAHYMARRGLSLPQSYLNYVLERELENIHVLKLSPARQEEVVSHALYLAANAYQALLDRTMECAQAQLPTQAVSIKQLFEMVEQALPEAIDQCETALYRAPLGVDLFADAVWPATKKRLAARLGVDCGGDDRWYRLWLQQLD